MPMTDLARSILRTLRALSARLLHPLRRSAAREALRLRPRPRSILFVCHGNICRSPYAACYARARLGGRGPSVASAGFIGADRPSPPEAVAAAAARGVDLAPHRSQLLSPALVQGADLVIVMDAEQLLAIRRGYPRPADSVLLLGDFDPGPVTSRAIPDPVDKPRAAFDACYARIDRCVDALLKGLPGA
jgi:protein-tyrosine phosphatase